MSQFIGVNISPSEVTGVVVTGKGTVKFDVACPTPKTGYEGYLRAVCATVRKCEGALGGAQAHLSPIGVGLSSVVVPGTQEVRSILLHEMNGRDVLGDLTRRLKKPVKIFNDVKAWSWLEAQYGKGKGYEMMLGVAFDDGVGAGLVINGRVINGNNGMTGEVGLTHGFSFDEEAQFKRLKQIPHIHLGDLASASGFGCLHEVMTGEPCTIDEASLRLKMGDRQTKRVRDYYCEIIAAAIKGFVGTFDPNIIVATGDVTRLSGFFKKTTEYLYMNSDRFANMKTLGFLYKNRTPVVPGSFKKHPFASGAALLAQHK